MANAVLQGNGFEVHFRSRGVGSFGWPKLIEQERDNMEFREAAVGRSFSNPKPGLDYVLQLIGQLFLR